MQHNRFGRKLRRTTSHRLALFRNQLMSVVEHERIETTLQKAKELRPLVERVVSLGKSDTVPARRKVFRWVPNRSLVKKVFEALGPRFTDRPGGYTRILRLGRRRGDNSEEAILEFVDFKFKAREKGPKKESTRDRARRAISSKVETIRKEKGEKEATDEAAAEAAQHGSEKKARPSKKAGAPKAKMESKARPQKAHQKESKRGQ
jgi:large subunit ribosomal protein L17